MDCHARRDAGIQEPGMVDGAFVLKELLSDIRGRFLLLQYLQGIKEKVRIGG